MTFFLTFLQDLLFNTLWAIEVFSLLATQVPAFAFKLFPGEVTSELGLVRGRERRVKGILSRVTIKRKDLDLT